MSIAESHAAPEHAGTLFSVSGQTFEVTPAIPADYPDVLGYLSQAALEEQGFIPDAASSLAPQVKHLITVALGRDDKPDLVNANLRLIQTEYRIETV